MFDRVPDMAARRADLGPEDTAFLDHASGRRWSFRAVNDAANGIAAGLRAAGLAQGDRLAILSRNRVEVFLTLFACQKTGVILCPLNWRQPAPELLDTLAPFGPRAILSAGDLAPTAATIAEALAIPHRRLEAEGAGWIAAGGPGSAGAIPADRVWYLLFTSGTTGRPKAVIHTARMAWANAVNIGQAVRLSGADRSVNFLPLFHTAGINLYTLPLFLNGGQSTVLPRFDVEAVLELMAAGAVTRFFGVPAIYQALSQVPAVERIDWSRLSCGCGGAPLPEPLLRFFAARGCRVLNGFGMTETGPTAFLMDPDHAEAKPGSVGRVQVLTEARLDGVPDGAPGQGEVLFRGPAITPGYFGDPEATAAAFAPGGWLRSGDVGRRDAEGFLWVVDRIKDMFISGGENVYPAEVERVLNDHPRVLEAAVVGVPDPRWGEVGAAFVIARPEAAAPGPTAPQAAGLDGAALRAWCRDRLAGYKVPATVRLVADLPRTAAGKVRKPALRALAQEWARQPSPGSPRDWPQDWPQEPPRESGR